MHFSWQHVVSLKQSQLELVNDCEADALEIYDGPSDSSTLLKTLCGAPEQEDLETKSNFLFVKFTSDIATELAGFNLTFSKGTLVLSGCKLYRGWSAKSWQCLVAESWHRMQVHLTHSTILPTMPPTWRAFGRYPSMKVYWFCSDLPALRCLKYWLKYSAVTSVPYLIQVENSTNCEADYVEVLDGPEESSPSLGKFCGNVIPGDLTSSSNHMLLKFVTNDLIELSGFQAEYEPGIAIFICESTIISKLCNCFSVNEIQRLTNASGQIVGPVLSTEDRTAKRYLWIIEVEESRQIFFKLNRYMVWYFTSSATSNLDSFSCFDQGTCPISSIVVRDGANSGDNLMFTHCDDTSLPQPVISSGNRLHITYIIGASQAYMALEASYRTIDCIHTLEGESGELASPNYPDPYPASQTCFWTITVPAGEVVELTFETFQVRNKN